MAKAAEVAGDIAAAGSALSGLLLVYIGGLSTSFGAFEAAERRSVAKSYLRRAWFAFVGFVLLLLSVPLALLGKWLDSDGLVIAGLAFLLLGLVWALVAAALTAMEIG